MKSSPKILVILGPTTSGKSNLAVVLAKKFNGEVISADSRQVYRGLDIGTGKITKKEMKGVRHHLLDVADPKKQFTAQTFKEFAEVAIADILSRGKLPIICGGTGFYIETLTNDSHLPEVKPDQALRKRLAGHPASKLLATLRILDPTRAEAMESSNSEKNNARRLIRAIEVAKALSKIKKEGQHAGADSESQLAGAGRAVAPTVSFQHKYDALQIGIKPSPVDLKTRIRARLDKRLTHGMIAEARRLHARGLSWKRMDELGLEYRYLARFLQGELTRKQLVETLSAKIWQYARRQMTWFRRDARIKWFGPNDRGKAARCVFEAIHTKH